MSKIPHGEGETVDFFKSVLPDDPRVMTRPMFGNISAFVNGNMFIGVYGNDVFVRLGESDRADLLKIKGTALFEPMRGRPMKEYVVIPRAWRKDVASVRPWILKSLSFAESLPPKTKKKRKK